MLVLEVAGGQLIYTKVTDIRDSHVLGIHFPSPSCPDTHGSGNDTPSLDADSPKSKNYSGEVTVFWGLPHKYLLRGAIFRGNWSVQLMPNNLQI